MVCTGLAPAGQLGSRGGATAAGARAVSSHLGQRRDAAGVIVDPALRDLEAVGLLAMRAVEINGPAARARDAAAIGVDAGLDLARGLRAQEYQFAHATLPKRGLTHSTGYGGHGELRPRAALGLPVDMWISAQAIESKRLLPARRAPDRPGDRHGTAAKPRAPHGRDERHPPACGGN